MTRFAYAENIEEDLSEGEEQDKSWSVCFSYSDDE